MRFNGIDIRSVHPALSVNKEIYPGMARREMITTRGNSGETPAGYQEERDEAIIRVNIAGKSKAEAYEVRALLAGWAASSGENTAPLEPTHWHGKAYDAIVSEISQPEFIHGFATVDVTFLLPRPYAYSMSQRQTAGEGEAEVNIGGTARTRPVVRQTMAASSQALTWSMDGAPFMRLTGTLAKGAVIEADFAKESLTIDGVHSEARIDYTATDWQPKATPGRHTLTSSDKGEIEARWRDVWI